MEVLLIDNYESPNSNWIKDLKITLDELCIRYEVKRFDDKFLSSRLDQFDAIVLSGSLAYLSQESTIKRYKAPLELIQKVSMPILGICFGHQLIGIAFGSRVVQLGMQVLGFTPVKILESRESSTKKDSLFDSLPDEIQVTHGNYEVVERLPKDFKLLAYSKDTAIEAMVHKSRLIYGIQFHAEMYNSENLDGKIVLQNFFNMI